MVGIWSTRNTRCRIVAGSLRHGLPSQKSSRCNQRKVQYINTTATNEQTNFICLSIVMTYLENAKKKIMPLMEDAKLISDDEANELGKKDVDR